MINVLDRQLITPAEGRQNGLTRSPGMYAFPEAPSRPEYFEQDEREKEFLRSYQMGKMGVFGPEGSGKGVFLAWLLIRMKRFWPSRPIVTDLFLTEEFNQMFSTEVILPDGEIIPRSVAEAKGLEGKLKPAYTFINPKIMLDQIERVEELAEHTGAHLSREERDDWVAEGKAGIVLRRAIVVVDEIDTWANKYRASSKTNEFVMGYMSRYRHFLSLFVGACPKKSKLNPDVRDDFMYEIYCSPDNYKPDYFNYVWLTISGIGPAGIQTVARKESSTIYGRPIYPFFESTAPVSVITKNNPRKKKKLISESA